MGGGPTGFLCLCGGGQGFQLPAPAGIKLCHLIENHKGILRIPAQVADRLLKRGACFTQGHPMGGRLPFIAAAVFLQCPLAHDGLPDDQRGFLLLLLCGLQGTPDLVRIMAVNDGHPPSPGFILAGRILGGDLRGGRRQLNVVGIIKHDEVAQSQVAGDTPRALGNLLLDAPVGNKGVGFMCHPLAEAGSQEPLGNGGPYGHGMPLPQGTRGVLHPTAHICLRMPRRIAPPLAEGFQVIHAIIPRARQYPIQHGRHMPRIKEKTVPVLPAHILRIITQKLTV